MPSCGDAASTAAFRVDLKSSSVSTQGMVVSFSACTNTSWRLGQLPSSARQFVSCTRIGGSGPSQTGAIYQASHRRDAVGVKTSHPW
jgi:hypothetical protein